MSLLNFILDLAALLLWANWRSLGFKEFVPYRSTLVHTLRSAAPTRPRRWLHFLALLGLLWARALLYRQLGSALGWVPHLDLQVIALPFRSDQPWRMTFFSFASFGLTLGVFYLWLLVLSVVNQNVPDTQPVQHLVRLHLGRVERWPWFVKLLLPLLVVPLLWIAVHPLLAGLRMVPAGIAGTLVLQQGLVLGMAAYLPCKYLLAGLLLLHVLNSYIYLGASPFWEFTSLTGRNLLRPVASLSLRLGRVDFAPILGIIVVCVVAELDARGLAEIFRRLPLW